eukprot:m.157456 g.157456  ORF g.157456 m.157456 type:complete len:189 (-) comp52958_c0_seq1:255-821(-)
MQTGHFQRSRVTTRVKSSSTKPGPSSQDQVPHSLFTALPSSPRNPMATMNPEQAAGRVTAQAHLLLHLLKLDPSARQIAAAAELVEAARTLHKNARALLVCLSAASANDSRLCRPLHFCSCTQARKLEASAVRVFEFAIINFHREEATSRMALAVEHALYLAESVVDLLPEGLIAPKSLPEIVVSHFD